MKCLGGCGKEAVEKKPRNRGKYCSLQCQANARSKETIEQWLRGASPGNTPAGFLKKNIRQHLLKQADNKCSQCGWSEKNVYTDTYPLEIDHIDGDHQNSTPDNLRVLCPNCHALTENFGSRNRGKGRRYFRLKYQSERQAQISHTPVAQVEAPQKNEA